MPDYPKKLIEVALPLDDINAAAKREKSIRHGHPSTLHLWWARRPSASARAVLFAQLVNDPGSKRGYGKYKGQTKTDDLRERERLCGIIRQLVKWENKTSIMKRCRHRPEKKFVHHGVKPVTLPGMIRKDCPHFWIPLPGVVHSPGDPVFRS